jgi:uncharacterized protein with GYD domain
MSLYLYQAAYTQESWKLQVERQENVIERITPPIEALGGHIVGFFYAFGEYDVVCLFEAPSDEAAAAAALAFAAGGSIKEAKTTKLMTVEQGLDAMRQASEAGKSYTAPIPQGTVRETVTR